MLSLKLCKDFQREREILCVQDHCKTWSPISFQFDLIYLLSNKKPQRFAYYQTIGIYSWEWTECPGQICWFVTISYTAHVSGRLWETSRFTLLPILGNRESYWHLCLANLFTYWSVEVDHTQARSYTVGWTSPTATAMFQIETSLEICQYKACKRITELEIQGGATIEEYALIARLWHHLGGMILFYIHASHWELTKLPVSQRLVIDRFVQELESQSVQGLS